MTDISTWISSRAIDIHPRVTFEASELGGKGIFITDGEPLKSGTELLRIPRSAVFDYESLLEVLNDLKKSEKVKPQSGIRASAAIVEILELVSPSTETEILTCYIWGFELCRRMLEKGSATERVLSPYTWYLDVLLSTETIAYPPEDLEVDDNFFKTLSKRARTEKETYDTLCSQLSMHDRFAELMPFKDFYQLTQAVKSRVLEIPQADGDQDDFYVNKTLVPLLDFANHSHEPAAYFDVNRKTDDVLLKVSERGLMALSEVTICYSPTESIQDFIATYGFIPSSHKDFQLFELKLESVNNLDNPLPEADKLCKWLRVNPRVQIVYDPAAIYLNLFNSNLPLLFIEGLSYNSNWRDNAFEDFLACNGVQVDRSNEATIVGFLEYQEENCDIINGTNPIGVLHNNAQVTLERLLQETEEDPNNAFESLVERASSFIARYMQQRLQQLKCFVKAAEAADDSFSRILQQYFALEANLLLRIVRKNKDPSSLLLPTDLANEEWETNYRSAPTQVPVEALWHQLEED